MKEIRWSKEKAAWLRAHRGLDLEEIAGMIERGEALDVVDHWNASRYPNQRVYILKIADYACSVPFVETDDEIFLKTAYRNRTASKRYLREH